MLDSRFGVLLVIASPALVAPSAYLTAAGGPATSVIEHVSPSGKYALVLENRCGAGGKACGLTASLEVRAGESAGYTTPCRTSWRDQALWRSGQPNWSDDETGLVFIGEEGGLAPVSLEDSCYFEERFRPLGGDTLLIVRESCLFDGCRRSGEAIRPRQERGDRRADCKGLPQDFDGFAMTSLAVEAADATNVDWSNDGMSLRYQSLSTGAAGRIDLTEACGLEAAEPERGAMGLIACRMEDDTLSCDEVGRMIDASPLARAL